MTQIIIGLIVVMLLILLFLLFIYYQKRQHEKELHKDWKGIDLTKKELTEESEVLFSKSNFGEEEYVISDKEENIVLHTTVDGKDSWDSLEDVKKREEYIYGSKGELDPDDINFIDTFYKSMPPEQ